MEPIERLPFSICVTLRRKIAFRLRQMRVIRSPSWTQDSKSCQCSKIHYPKWRNRVTALLVLDSGLNYLPRTVLSKIGKPVKSIIPDAGNALGFRFAASVK